ncbi:MAG: hypothetical protein WBA57_07740 [Elainellaceae cyanobacterium]
MILEFFSNTLPAALQAIFVDSGFLSTFAPGLGESLASTCGQFATAKLVPVSAPGLVESIKSDTRYVEALKVYERQLAQANVLQNQALQAQQQFSQQLLILLGEWQVNLKQNQLNELRSAWDRDNWFSKLDRQETLDILGQRKHQLLILAAPPEISKSCPTSFRDNLATEVRNGTSSFLYKNYSPNSNLCPTLFYADYFKQSISALDVKRLQSVLGSVPTAIIYSEVTDYQANFHVGFWSPQSRNIAQFDLPTWNWEQSYEILKKKWLNDKTAYRQIREAIVLIHQLLASFVADWYYLSINSFYEPRLLVDLNISKLSESSLDIFKPYIETLRKLQQLQRVAYLKERGFLDKTIAVDTNSTSAQIALSSYRQKLNNVITQNGYPLNRESQEELKLVQSILNLNDQKIGEISQPILTQKEREYRKRQKQLEQQRKLEQRRELERKNQKEREFASIQRRAILESMFGNKITVISTVTLVFFLLVWLLGFFGGLLD